mgnify:CR=1 FL=1|jgi:hypothetical protein
MQMIQSGRLAASFNVGTAFSSDSLHQAVPGISFVATQYCVNPLAYRRLLWVMLENGADPEALTDSRAMESGVHRTPKRPLMHL